MKYFLILLIIISSGCKKKFANAVIMKLYEEVMLVHDTVMPEMSTINRLKKKVRKIEPQSDTTLTLINNLDVADEEMMYWMANFKFNDKASIVVQTAYLKNEKILISNVDRKMRESISEAQSFLSKNNK